MYRNVHLLVTEEIHVPVWGTQITTPHVNDDFASVCLRTKVEGAEQKELTVVTDIISPDSVVVTSKTTKGYLDNERSLVQNFIVENPYL